MLKYLFMLCAAVALCLLPGCSSSLPEGARKPEVTVQKLVLSSQEQQQGFLVKLICQHDSKAPLQLEAVEIKVFINGKPAASYREEPKKMLIRPKGEVLLSYFVPANLLGPLAQASLASPMISVKAEAQIKLFFDADENSAFNPTTLYQGVISRGQ